jgi:hypothetical protein
MNAAESDARLYALLKARGCVEPFDDPHMLEAEILSILFNLIPNANRVALLLSREDAPQVPDHFWCEAYGKRTGEPKRFKVSREAIEWVYRYGHPYISQNAICAPLLRENLFVMGLIYLDTRKRRGFDDEEMETLQMICGPAARFINRSIKRQEDREELDSYSEHLELDEFDESQGKPSLVEFMISAESITKVCDAINRLTDAEYKRELDRFLDAQSLVLNYFFEKSVPNEKRMLDFVVKSSFMIWKCYEAEPAAKTITVGWDHLEAAIHDMKAWWSRLHAEIDHMDPEELEPLLRHILVEIDALSHCVELSSREKNRLTKVMKSIMLSFERAAADPSV